jgi:hypothetical protein
MPGRDTMSRKKVFFAILCFVFSEVCALAQTNQEEKERLTNIVPGFMFKLGSAPNPWRTTLFSNLPESIRTVNYGNVPYGGGGSYTFAQDQLKLHLGGEIFPIELGPTLNFRDHLEFAAGGIVTFERNRSNQMQIGCYCAGSTVTFITFNPTSVHIGAFGEASVRIKGPVWFMAEASSSPIWSNIFVRQAFSAYNSNDTLLKEHFGNFRIPLTVLAGLKFCVACYKEWHAMAGVSVGYGYWQNHVDLKFPDVQYPHNQRHLLIQAFIEHSFFFGKKKK